MRARLLALDLILSKQGEAQREALAARAFQLPLLAFCNVRDTER
jgi:hypothetical protein